MRIYGIAVIFLTTLASTTYAEVVKGVVAEGACAIVGMSAEQCQLAALQRARAAAIEKAAGVQVSSSTLVTNMMLATEYIKSYSRGFIVREQVEWSPLGQYQADSKTAPIPEYRVKISADVAIPEQRIRPIGLQAQLNKAVFRAGEKAQVEVKVGRKARIAIFNIMADDRVVMLYPNEYDKSVVVDEHSTVTFPDRDSPTELVMQTLPGHERDAEAFFIVALDADYAVNIEDLFPFGTSMRFDKFFEKFTEVAHYSEDLIVAYEIVGDRLQ
jgi:hypothetical protein